jgi:cell division protein FtsI/penicillin-binding protein 2
VLGQIQAAPRTRFLKLLTLSPADYASHRHGLARVPGLVIKAQTVRLFSSIAPDVVGGVETETSPELKRDGISYHPGATVGKGGLQSYYQPQLAGTPTTEVVAETPDGSRVTVLHRWLGHASAPVRTTIDAGVQQAADQVAEAAPGSTAIVAVQASTGRVLAATHHQAGPVIDPLATGYPPGGAFTIVSTEALLAAGVQTSAPLRCTSSSDVGGQNFYNVPPVTLDGSPPLVTNFAHGCWTAFAGLARRFQANPSALNAAAAGFGIGAGWQLPGLLAFTGSLPSATTEAGLAAATIGQGGVQVSPLGMALVAAAVDAGAWHAPSVTIGQPQTQAVARNVLSASRIQALRTFMRAAVASGAAHEASLADLAGLPVYGQVGSTPYQGKWANWFVGYRGDVAFAVLQLAAAPSTAQPATIAAQFLTGLPGQ